MGTKRTLAAYGITAYRVTLALTNGEWAKLRAEAERTDRSGARLIELILQDVCSALPEPAPEPLPEDPGEESDQEG